MRPDEHRLVDDILADAFSENAFARSLLGVSNTRGRLRLLNRSAVRHKHATIMVAEVDGRPSGALLYADSPHCEPEGFAMFRMILDAVRVMRWRIFRTFGVFRAAEKNHPEWPHRHLNILGVTLDAQGKGVGSALLKRFCDDLDAAGKNSYLETDSEGAKRLYERFGFREVGRTPAKGYDLIYMWRTANKTDGTLGTAI